MAPYSAKLLTACNMVTVITECVRSKVVQVETSTSEKPDSKSVTYKRLTTWVSVSLVTILVVVTINVILYLKPEKLFSDKPQTDGGDVGDDDFSARGSLRMYTQQQWGGYKPLNFTPLHHPVDLVIIAHTVTQFCLNFVDCAASMRNMQNYHVSNLKVTDIKYNFVIGADGCVYVGRGWDAHNTYLPRESISISFTGNFISDSLTDRIINAAQKLLALGVDLGKIAADYKLVCDNQTSNTLSPGENVYEVVKDWDHFYPGRI